MSAAQYKLDNLTWIVDNNGLQIMGENDSVMGLGDLAAKYRAFGFEVIEIDGHDYAQIIDALESELTDEEEAVYHRGRNAKSYTSAKNASIIEYRKATGLEALCGYLYLQGKQERMLELIQNGLAKVQMEI